MAFVGARLSGAETTLYRSVKFWVSQVANSAMQRGCKIRGWGLESLMRSGSRIAVPVVGLCGCGKAGGEAMREGVWQNARHIVIKITALCLRRREHFRYPQSVSLCGNGGGPMNRDPSCCDFCGSLGPLIPYDEPGFCWYACPECTQIIEEKGWGQLEDRCLAAYGGIRIFSDDDKSVISDEVAALIQAFRGPRLAPAC